MKKDLVTTFTNSLGKEHDWTYKGLNPDLPVPAIKEACELLTSLDIFEQDGVKLFHTVVTAKIVTTIETEIFDKEKNPPNDADYCEEARVKEDTIAVPMPNEDLSAKAGRSYDYLYSKSRTTIEEKLAVQADPINCSLSPKSEETIIKKQPLVTEENSVITPSEPLLSQSELHKSKKAKKGFFAWLPRKKNRNKDDPDIRSGDPISSG